MDSLTWLLDLLALLYALVFFPAPIFWLIIHPAIEFWRRFGARAYWMALPLWLLSGITLLVLRADLFADRLNRNAVTTLIGTGLVLLGLWLNRRVHHEFNWRRLVGFPEINPERHAGGVVRSGIYANLRHPRYLEFMITFMGLALLTGAVGIFVLAIITVLLYLIVTPLEERELRQQYGQEYEAYRSEVPRFLPGGGGPDRGSILDSEVLMRNLVLAALLAGVLLVAAPLPAQQVCPSLPYLVNTPEDELMLAYNGAENPQEQIAALDKFAQEHADSKFLPCVYELYTLVYLKQNDYAKVIQQGEKGLAQERPDIMLLLNLAKAYVSSGTATDTAFEAILKAPASIQAESTPARPPNVGDEEWKKIVDETTQQAKDWRGYMEYAFFQLLQREPDGNKRVQRLDSFVQAYPDSPNAGQINFNYFIAYKMANNAAKTEEFAEKAVAAEPNNVSTLNVVADDYATRQTNLDRAEEYAKKALELAGSMKKPEGMTDEQFKAQQDSQLGFAHLTLGYISFQKNSKTKKVAPAIQEFRTATDLLGSNPALQGRALFYEGYAYEVLYPANHKAAFEALSRSAGLASPWQGQAQELLEKVKKAMGQ